MQVLATSASTHKLTRSFGWGREKVLDQEDVHEFSKFLFDAIEDSGKVLVVLCHMPRVSRILT